MNTKIRNTIDFLEYLSKPMKKDDVLLLYRINNIIPEKVELYLDFVEYLYELVTTTYLGDDVMGENDCTNHFNWCWSKVINSFKKERIYFEDNIDIHTYFSSLFLESFYEEDDKSNDNISQLIDFWRKVLKYNPTKTRSELESLFDLYKLFEESIHV